MELFRALLCLALTLSGVLARATTRRQAANYPAPLPCSGEGCDTITVSIQDFNVIQHTNGTYFRFSKSNSTGQGLGLATAQSLAGPWITQVSPLAPPLQLLSPLVSSPANRSASFLWTPDVHYIDDLYYLYYSIFNSEVHPSFDIAVATSPSMEDGTWTDHGPIGVLPSPNVSHDYAAIDSHLLVSADDPMNDEAGPQLVFGSFNAALVGVNLSSSNPLRVSNYYQTNYPTPLITDQMTAVADPSVHGYNRTEGSYHFQRGSYVYYIFSQGSCCGATESEAYVTKVCRATHAAGLYTDADNQPCLGNNTNGAGTVLLESHTEVNGGYEVLAPGSVGVVDTPADGLILTYQYKNQSAPVPPNVAIPLYYGHNYLGFTADGWPFVAESPQS